MAKSRKRKKAVVKAKREYEGQQKHIKNVKKHHWQKRKEQMRELQRKIETLRTHKANTIEAQAEDIYSQIVNQEEE